MKKNKWILDTKPVDIKPEQMKKVEDLIEYMCSPVVRSISEIADDLDMPPSEVRKLLANSYVRNLIQSRIDDITLTYQARVWDKLMEKIELENSLDAIKVFFNLIGKNPSGKQGGGTTISINNGNSKSNEFDSIINSMDTEDLESLVQVRDLNEYYENKDDE